MRLTTLSLTLMTLGLTACASLPQQHATQSGQTLAQQATTALNSPLENLNYDFSSRLYTNLNIKEKPSINHNSGDIQKSKQIITQYFANQNIKLSDEQLDALYKQLEQSLDSTSLLGSQKDTIFLKILENVLQYSELRADGSIDLRQKRASVAFNAQYQDANLSVQYRMPFLLDLQNQMLYINNNDHATLNKKAKSTTYYLDFKDSKKELGNIDWKGIKNYLKTSNAILFESLIGDENIQEMPLTAEERKLGAVKKIRLNSSWNEITAKGIVNGLVNKQYINKLFDFDKLSSKKSSSGYEAEAKSETVHNIVADQIDEHYYTLYKNKAPVEDYATDAYKYDDNEYDDESDTQEKAVATPSHDECQAILQKPSNFSFGKVAFCHTEDQTAKSQEQKNNYAKLPALFAQSLLMREQLEDTLKDYDNGTLKTVAEFNSILEKHKAEIEEVIPQEDKIPVIIDVLLDSQGRIVRQASAIVLDTDLPNQDSLKGTINFDLDVKNYGKAKVSFDESLSNAKPLDHLFKKNARVYSYDTADDLLDSAYEQTKSYEKAYAAAFIAFLSDEAELINYASAQDLQEIALVFAYNDKTLNHIFNADKQKRKQIKALEEKHDIQLIDDSVRELEIASYRVSNLIEDLYEKNQVNDSRGKRLKSAKDLKAKLKTPEAVFAEIYIQTYTINYLSGGSSQGDQKSLAKLAKSLAKIYTLSSKEGIEKVDQLIEQLPLESEQFFYPKTYTDTAEMVDEIFKP